MAEAEPPLDEAMDMKKKGLDKNNIVEDLKNKGYKPTQVSDAMNQMDIKNSVGGDMQPSVLDQNIPVPEPPKERKEMQQQNQQITYQRPIQNQPYSSFKPGQEELVESIVDEKWQQMVDVVGDIELWKSKLDDELTAIKQEILRMSNRMDNIQRSVLGKVTEYNQNITGVETDIKALEKVMKNILQPLTSNIKELSRVTDELKGTHHTTHNTHHHIKKTTRKKR